MLNRIKDADSLLALVCRQRVNRQSAAPEYYQSTIQLLAKATTSKYCC